MKIIPSIRCSTPGYSTPLQPGAHASRSRLFPYHRQRPVGATCLGIVALLFLALLAGCGGSDSSNTPPTGQVAPLSVLAQWQPQDYETSRGITAVQLTNSTLVLTAHMIGGDPQLTNGEALMDFNFYPGLESKVPLDLSHSVISMTCSVPAGFVGDPSKPNGIQLFVKDDTWRAQYSAWQNVTAAGTYQLTCSPTAAAIDNGYTEPGFDPTRIRILGVKFGIGTGSTAQFDGVFTIRQLTITPPIQLTPVTILGGPLPPTFAPGATIEARSDGFYLDGKKWFIVGGNWRMLLYGQNFGTTAWFPFGNGVSKHAGNLQTYLTLFQSAGIKVVRVGLLDDGRTMFDAAGHVVGYNDVFRQDVQTLLNLANAANVKVEFVLVDYLLAGKAEEVEGVWVRGREEIFTDQATGEEFITGFLTPLVTEFGSHPALFGFDLINEPEWIVSNTEGGDWESVTDLTTKAPSPITRQQLQTFAVNCCTAIRQHAPGKVITMGVSIKYAGLLAGLPLDYSALHFYPWMGELADYASAPPVGRPWLLEEFPTVGAAGTAAAYYDRALGMHASGAMLWNLTPAIDNQTVGYDNFIPMLRGVRNWGVTHGQEVYAGN